jgi:hypothetical protein
MEATGLSETLVTIYKARQCHSPENDTNFDHWEELHQGLVLRPSCVPEKLA